MSFENRPTYRREFEDLSQAQRYDALQYAAHSWSTLLGDLERSFLHQALARPDFVPRRERYLDFACGTGRVTEMMSARFSHSVGIDISAAMLDRARMRVPSAHFVQGDVITTPELAGDGYDLLTSFRFLLNADDSDRVPALKWMRSRLREDSSRIIVNNHANFWSHKAVSHALRRLRQGSRGTTGNVLSHKEMVRLVDASGLSIRSVYGVGFLGGHVLRVVPFDKMSRLQHMLNGAPVLQKFAENQIYVLSAR